jgi:hypothetical protein
MIWGGVVSVTVTLKLSVVVSGLGPVESVAEQVTTVVPSGKGCVGSGRQVGVSDWLGTLAVPAVTVTDTVAPAGPVASAVWSPGLVNVGRVRFGPFEFETTTGNEALTALFEESVAVQTTVVSPIGKFAPFDGEKGVALAGVVHVTLALTSPSTVSIAVTANVRDAVVPVAAVPVISAGTVSVGGVWSATAIVTCWTLVLPNTSVAVQLIVVLPIGKTEPGPAALAPLAGLFCGVAGVHDRRRLLSTARAPGGRTFPVLRFHSAPADHAAFWPTALN